jgi:hypothetical protein
LVIALALWSAASCSGPTSPSGTPQASGVTPPSGAQGTTVTITIAGEGFTIGDTAAVVITGRGVTVSNVRVQSATTAVATLTIAPTAPLGSRKLTLTTSTGGTSADLTFTVVPPAPRLTAISPTTAAAGTPISLALTGTNFIGNATTVAVSGAGITVGQVSVQKSTALTVNLTIGAAAAAGARDVTVKTAGGTSAARTLTIEAAPATPGAPSIGAFAASPANITNGQTATLSWSGITNATTCSIDNGVGSVSCGNGSVNVAPGATTTYTLTASGAATSATATATVTVSGTSSGGGPTPPTGPAIGSFDASPSSITSGQSSRLSWSGIANATSCSINRGVGTVACSDGSTNVSPTSTTTYTLTATGDGGSVTATTTITVNAPAPTAPAIGSFTANPSTITNGQSSRLSWSGITNAATCSFDNGVGSVSCADAGRNVSPTATTTYTLTATGPGGSATATATVTVTAPAAPAIGSFTASPTTVTSGQPSTLTWSGITDATTCSIDNGVGNIACGNGNVSVTPAATTTYTLTATGAGGSTTATATVTVSGMGPMLADNRAISRDDRHRRGLSRR